MKRNTIWLCVAVLMAAAPMAMTVEGSEQDYDYSKGMREEHRRNLPEYIELLHHPDIQNSPSAYPQLVLSIANSKDPRAIETMIEVMSDTVPRLMGDACLTAAEFLGAMGDKRAIPVLKENLTLVRRFGPPGESAKYTPGWNNAVHLAAAAALFELGELQAALPVFRSVLAMGDRVPSNALRAVGSSIEAYRDRPEALDTIHQYFREATESKNPELRVGAAERLVGVDTELAFRLANEALALSEPEDNIHRHVGDTRLPAERAAQIAAILSYRVSGARVKAVYVLKAIGDARAKQLLKTLVHDPDESVRIAADYALRELARGKK